MRAIYYFTRTGTCEKTAKEIAEKNGGEIYKIEDGRNWSGIIGYIKAGYNSSKKKAIPITYRVPQEDEQIVLVTPLWAGGIPPAARTFVNEVGREKITLVVCSLGAEVAERNGYKRVIDVVAKYPKKELIL